VLSLAVFSFSFDLLVIFKTAFCTHQASGLILTHPLLQFLEDCKDLTHLWSTSRLFLPAQGQQLRQMARHKLWNGWSQVFKANLHEIA